MSPSDPFFGKYGAAITRMHELPDGDPRNWCQQAIIHADHCPHSMPDFLQWHRFYITYFERICGELIADPNFALPYWDWTNNAGRLPAPFFENNALNVEFWNDPSNYTPPPTSRSPWGRIRTLGRRALTPTYGMGDSQWAPDFRASRIEGIKRLRPFSRFSGTLEGTPHNLVHLEAGRGNGHIGSGLSPLDPVFWLHHCNVDRIWAEWQAARNPTPSDSIRYESQFVDEQGEAVSVGADEARDHLKGLQFTYDTIGAQPSPLLTDADLPPKSIADLAAFAAEPEAISLGRSDNDQSSFVDVETRVSVDTPRLAEVLFGSRTFQATSMLGSPRKAVEPARFVAALDGITYPEPGKERLAVKVFLNCPYLAPSTPTSDPHYAGAFAFFGPPMEGMNGKGHFEVEITEPLRELAAQGRLEPSRLNVQLMPVARDDGSSADATFKVTSVEVLKV